MYILCSTRRGIILNEDLLYGIGEAILLEAKDVEDVTYDGENIIVIITEDNKRYLLTLTEL